MWGEETPMLSIRGLRKSFGGHEVLAGVDLEVRPGEVLGVVGQNGVGKSTMASIVAGRTEADSGEMTIAGEPWNPKRVMLIDPELELDGNLTVTQAMFREFEGERTEAQFLAAARRVIVELGVPLLPSDRLGDLGSSDRRMAEVLRMIADPRDLIVIDELSNTLNAREVEDLRYALQHATEKNRGIVYITHRLEEALRLCNRIAVLRDGHVVKIFDTATTTPDELTEAMFGRTIGEVSRRGYATDDVVLDVPSLHSSGEPVSFQLHAGEILGLCGARNSGVEDILGALTGQRPDESPLVLVAGKPARITAPRDLPGLRIAVLSSMLDPAGETHFAWNLTMMDGEAGASDDSTVEDTTRILMAIRQSEIAMSKLLNRPLQSTGQRRWQQLQEIAAKHARIMILIEPMESLDMAARERFIHLMEEVTERGVGILLFSSDEKDLHQLSDRILVVEDGAVRDEWVTDKVAVADLQSVSRGEWPSRAAGLEATSAAS